MCVRGTPRFNTWPANAPRLHGYTLYSTLRPKSPGSLSWKKLLRIISMRLWFSSKSLKYLRIYPTFHEYPKESKAVSPVRRRTSIHQRSLQMVLSWPEFSKKEITSFRSGDRYSLSYFSGLKCEDVISREAIAKRDLFSPLSFRFTINSRKVEPALFRIFQFFPPPPPPPKRKYLVFRE